MDVSTAEQTSRWIKSKTSVILILNAGLVFEVSINVTLRLLHIFSIIKNYPKVTLV